MINIELLETKVTSKATINIIYRAKEKQAEYRKYWDKFIVGDFAEVEYSDHYDIYGGINYVNPKSKQKCLIVTKTKHYLEVMVKGKRLSITFADFFTGTIKITHCANVQSTNKPVKSKT